MSPLADCRQECLRGFRTNPSVPALFGPRLNSIPTPSEVQVLANPFETGLIKARNLDQFPQLVRIARLHPLLVWEFKALSSLCDAGLERALHCIASQVVCAVKQAQPKQSGRFLQPDSRKLLEIFSVHQLSS